MAETNDIAPGAYHIVSAANTALALDVDGARTTNRAPVYAHTQNYSDAQVWELSYREDGTAQVLYRYAGKALEVYGATASTVKPGAQLSTYTDNDTDAQRWDLVPTGSTVTVGGASYDTYQMRLVFDTAYAAAAASASSGAAVRLATPSTSDARQAWAFVPVASYRDGGLYEIHSVMDTRMVWDVNGLSKANGANLMLGNHNGGNNQKFVMVAGTGEYEGYWALRSVYSGKCMHTATNAVKDGTNVYQWAGTGDNAWWLVTAYGTKAIDGTECQVLSFGARNNTSYLIDAQGAMTSNATNLWVWHNNQGANQEWALLPTSATDANMPTPYDLGVTYSVGDESEAVLANAERRALLYPTWSCADGWTRGANHYQVRTRSRLMSPTLGAWGGWTDWTAWETAAVTASGNRCWLTRGVAADYAVADAHAMQIGIQVRCVGPDGDGLSCLYGPVAEATVQSLWRPTVTLAGAGWSADGLHLGYSSDYPSANRIHVTAVTTTGADGVARRTETDLSFVGQDGEGSFVVPAGDVTWPADGTDVVVEFEVGTDVWARFDGAESQTLAVAYAAGSGTAVEPSLEMGAARVLLATVPHLGTDRMWLRLDDGTLMELDGEAQDAGTMFRVPYPFGRSFQLWTSCVSEDGDAWGTDCRAYAPTDAPMRDQRPAHAFMWDGGCCCLELKGSSSDADTYRSLSPSYEALSLNGRSRQDLAYGSVVASRFTADGVLVEGVSEAEAAQFERDLVEARHVTYRSPNGHVVRAGVTMVTTTYSPTRVKVSVDLTEEAE